MEDIIKEKEIVGGLTGGSSGSAAGTDLNTVAGLGSASDSLTNFAATGATSGMVS